MSTPPPTLRNFLQRLLPILHPSSLPPTSPNTSLSPSSPLTPTLKPLFLTLHVLFPNELLPALDLLDRNLVTRLRYSDPQPSEDHGDGAPKLVAEGSSVYYVRTSQQARVSRFSRSGRATAVREDVSYEVRLWAWNCTCAAFAFGAFAGDRGDDAEGWGRGGGALSFEGVRNDVELSGIQDGGHLRQLWEAMDEEAAEQEREREHHEWSFGGLTGGERVPMCKHLLACVLSERVKELRNCIEDKSITTGEMAGWAAGWGG